MKKNIRYILLVVISLFFGGIANSQINHPIQGNTSPLPGSSETYYVNLMGGAGGVTCALKWTITSGVIISPCNVGGTECATVLTPGVAAIIVKWNCSPGASFSVSAVSLACNSGSYSNTLNGNIQNTAPVAGTISGTDTVCLGETMGYSSTFGANTSSYNWQIVPSSAGVIQSGQGTENITIEWLEDGDHDVKVTPINPYGCTGTQQVFDVNVKEPTPISFTQSTATVCGGATGVTYTVAPTSADPDILSYSWTLPIGVHTVPPGATTASITVDFDPYAQSGNITATSNYACGPGASISTPVTVNVLPYPPSAIQGAVAVCNQASTANTSTYSINAVTNATDYDWQISGGSILSSPPYTNTITVQWNSVGTGILSVRSHNTCGYSPATSTLNVTVHPSTAVAIVDTVTFNHTALTALSSSDLVFNHCASSDDCSNKIIDKAKLFLLFNTGEDYNYGSNAFTTSVEVEITGYGGIGGTGPVIISKTVTLAINEDAPEQLYHLDFSTDYYQIHSFDIDIISYTGHTTVEDDIQLVAYYEEDFKFNAQSSSPLVTNLVNTNLQPTSNQYQFTWSNSCVAFPNYEIQLLRLYNSDSTNTSAQTTISADVDWKEALSIETYSSDTTIKLTLAEGTGYYVWRVRPIGNYYSGGIANDKNRGLWSDHGIYTQGATGVGGTTGSAYIFFYNQFNDTINWIYSRTFTEGNNYKNEQVRISENMTFANGLQQARQTQAHLSTTNKILTTQTVMDFSGRPALSTIPVPLDDEISLGFKPNFLKNLSSIIYTAEDFDDDTNYQNPGGVTDGPGEHFAYYSDNNADVTIPGAEQYPFTRTLFYNDGNSRVKEQSGVGATFKITANLNDSRTTKTFYSGVADEELIRVFGDEAPIASSVHKVINVDGNNTASVTYIGKDGKTLATCLAINGSNTIGDNTAPLMGLASQNVASLSVSDTINNTTPYGDYGNQATTSQTFMEETTVNIHYDLTPKAVQDLCLEYCATCDYYIEISIQEINQPDSAWFYHEMLLPSGICDSANLAAYEMDTTVTLSPGTYIFTKRVVANNTDTATITTTDSIGSTYFEIHQDSLRIAYDSLIYGASGQLAVINGYLDSADIEGLYTYLGININQPTSVFEDSVVYVTIGCDSIAIPIILCEPKICPPDTSFAAYFNAYWAEVNPSANYAFSSISGGYSNAEFDTLVSNMISDGYSCDSLWDCWYSIVQNYEQLNDSLYGNPNLPAGITFNIVDAFLDCAGRRIEGIEPPGTFDKTLAYKIFSYTLGSNTTCEDYFVDQYAPTSCTSPFGSCFVDSTWTEFYYCVTHTDPNHPGTPTAIVDPDSAAQAITDTCRTYCEKQKTGYIDAIISAFHQNQQYVAANPDTSNTSVYLFSGDIYTLEYDSTFSQYFFNDTIPLDSQSTTYIPWTEIECMAEALVNYCKQGCTITPVYDSITSDLISMGTEEQIAAYQNSFMSAYEVSLPVVDPSGVLACGEGWEMITSGGVNPAMIDTIIAYDTTSFNSALIDSYGDTIYCYTRTTFRENLTIAYPTDDTAYCLIDSIYYEYYECNQDPASPLVVDSTYSWTGSECWGELLPLCDNDFCFRYVPWPQIPDSIPVILPLTCAEVTANDLKNSINHQVYEYIEEKIDSFATAYSNTCVNPDSINDNFVLNYPLGYHHYTLYYYNRAGTLIQTVPPQGVDLLDKDNANDPIDEYTMNRNTAPKHRFITDYEYNSLGQLIKQDTPDGDTTEFYYNNLGQLRFSQNAQQQVDSTYSYTKYDALGRILEVGQSTQAISNNNFTLDANIANTLFPNDVTKNEQVTYTVYTESAGVSYLNDGVTTQRYLQNRVSYSYTDADGDPLTTDDQTYTYYSYDPHGNVEWLVQDIPGFLDKQYLRYEYDLVSGNVLKVAYNEGRTDQFYHRYAYDADNRIIKAETSVNDITWEKDAQYDYYIHGPLARTALGEDKIQGLDYIYTIQGWLKALNHASLDKSLDPSNDGTNGTSNFAKDVFAMQLGYFTGDFNRSGSPYNTNTGGTVHATTLNPDANRSLYNGNISTWATNHIAHPNDPLDANTYTGLTGYQYRYDELNRIRIADFKQNVSLSGFSSALTAYSSTYDYDANGNFYNLSRNGNATGGTDMDSLKYYYYDISGSAIYDESSTVPTLPSNKLAYVTDNVTGSSYADDLESQASGNYTYDKIGNLISDAEEEIQEIKWTVYGKISEIIRTSLSTKSNLKFIYDASGNRIAKIVIPDVNDPEQNTITWYSRDASGNIMAIYESTYTDTTGGMNEFVHLIEQPMYGSSRLGTRTEKKLIKTIFHPTGGGTSIEANNLLADRSAENTHLSIGVQRPLTVTYYPGPGNFNIGVITPNAGGKMDVDFTNPASPAVSATNYTFNFGVQGNNVCVVEDGNNNVAFRAFTAKQVGFNNSVCRVLDAGNNLMPQSLTNPIKANWKGKSMGMKKPGTTDEYYLFTVGTDKKPYYHVINTTTGAVTSVNNLLDATGTNYGYGMALIIDDTPLANSTLYLRRYNSTNGTAEIVTIAITTGGIGTPIVPVSFSSYDANGTGEIQISPDGTKLAIANHKSSYGWWNTQGEIRTYHLNPAHEIVSLYNTFSTGNLSMLQSFDFSPSSEFVFYERQSTLLVFPPVGSNNGKSIKRLNIHTQHDTLVAAGKNGEVRRAKNQKLYVMDNNLSTAMVIHTPDAAFTTTNPTILAAPWKTTRGMSLNPHRISIFDDSYITREMHLKNYEISDHLGNVRAVVSDLKESTLNVSTGAPEDFEPELKVINNLYAFGSNQPNRSFFDADGSGTFGFNGMLKDNEIKGEGNSYDFGARIYDPRIGRFLSTDPATKLYPYYSPYQFAGNKPIDHIDYNGEHEWKITYIHNSSGDIVQTKLQLVKYGNFSPLNPHWYNSYHYIINSDGSVSRYNIGSGGPNSNSTHRPNAPSNILARTDNALPHINTKTWEWKDNGLFPTKFKNISKHVWGVSNDPISVQPRIPYSMSTFNSSSSFQQQIMTQPSQAAIDEIGVLASQYKAGIIANISIEIRTNLGQDSQGIQKSNNLRQSALVDALIDSGVKREDITILPQKYNQTTWDAEINYKRVLKPDIEE